VAGVPPDFFSATGQRWGNPLYRWDKMAGRGYEWWIRRLKFNLTTVDILRLDHFRGFAAYWEVPAEEETAVNGQWVDGPGAPFFEKVAEVLGDLPIIAEDLGLITPDVEELRDQFHLPGMKVLHFAFGDTPRNPYLPHNYTTPNAVVYTGTHDNDTTLGWFQSISSDEREKVQTYLGRDGRDICWDLIRLAYSSVADMAVVPLQDILRLGTEARMNVPGVTGANWAWRYREGMLTQGLAEGLRTFSEIYGRLESLEEEDEEEADKS
jgi:4-alpha-glucanotransferase